MIFNYLKLNKNIGSVCLEIFSCLAVLAFLIYNYCIIFNSDIRGDLPFFKYFNDGDGMLMNYYLSRQKAFNSGALLSIMPRIVFSRLALLLLRYCLGFYITIYNYVKFQLDMDPTWLRHKVTWDPIQPDVFYYSAGYRITKTEKDTSTNLGERNDQLNIATGGNASNNDSVIMKE